MPAKPLVRRLVLFTLIVLTIALRSHAAPAPATLVLFPRTLTKDDDVRALVDIRKHLRSDTAYEVITYAPNSSAVKRAASEANHPEWLTDPMGNDPERLTLTRAMGANCYVVIDKADERGKTDVRVGDASASARTWSAYDQKSGDAAKFIVQQVTVILASALPPAPAPVTPPTVVPAPVVPAPVVPAPVVPAPVVPAPVVPAPVVPAPVVPAPVVPAPVVPTNPVSLPAPSAPAPITLPAVPLLPHPMTPSPRPRPRQVPRPRPRQVPRPRPRQVPRPVPRPYLLPARRRR